VSFPSIQAAQGTRAVVAAVVMEIRCSRDMARRWEPDESRDSCPLLGERRGATPLRQSPLSWG
jgi:hypothetical protein